MTLRYPPRVSYGFGVSATNELLRDISGYLQEQLWGRKASDDFGSPYPRGKVLTAGINLSVLEIGSPTRVWSPSVRLVIPRLRAEHQFGVRRAFMQLLKASALLPAVESAA